MRVIKNENVIVFDVDGTLVTTEPIDIRVPTTFNFNGNVKKLWVIWEHVELLKNFYQRGFHIVVWSHGGWAWAEHVVKTLELEQYVDEVKTKPHEYVDDLDSREWMKRLFLVKQKGILDY